jgi:hypothetical protein
VSSTPSPKTPPEGYPEPSIRGLCDGDGTFTLEPGATGTCVVRNALLGLTVVTFDPLAPDFTQVTTYSESGMDLNGGSQHFHTVADLNGGTAAQDFESDGIPFVWTRTGGGTFSLISVDILGNDCASATLTASNGAVQPIGGTGTLVLPSTLRGHHLGDVHRERIR